MSYPYASPEHFSDTDPSIGQRAWYLQEARKLEVELGFSTSNFTVVSQQFFAEIGIDGAHFDTNEAIQLVENTDNLGFRAAHPELIEGFARCLAPHVDALRAHTETLQGESIIVRASPLDEAGRPELSFAGAYKGYMPLEPMSRDEHLVWGTATMLAGRFTQYGNCYYERHSIKGERRVGAIYMEPFFDLLHDTPLFYGTAYIADNHIRNEYHVTPSPDEPLHDPRLFVQRDGQVWREGEDQSVEEAFDFNNRMDRVLHGLQSHFKSPLDVEYAMDPHGDLYVIQLRPISEPHLKKWRSLPLVDEAGIAHRSAIINSIGTIEGKVIDLRDSVENIDIAELNNGIVVIRQNAQANGIDSQMLFQLARQYNLKGLRVIIDHSGSSRLRNHLPYALAEDPGMEFIVQTHSPDISSQLQHNKNAEIASNGIGLLIKTR